MGDNRGGWTYKFDAADYIAVFYDSENGGSTGTGSSGTVPAGDGCLVERDPVDPSVTTSLTVS